MILPTPQERPTLTVTEAARILGIGKSSYYEGAARGSLPVLRVGRRALVPTVALWRLLGMEPPATGRESL